MIYPNPTDGLITIDFEKSQEEISARLQTIMGKVVDTITIKHENKIERTIDEGQEFYLLELSDITGTKALISIVKQKAKSSIECGY